MNVCVPYTKYYVANKISSEKALCNFLDFCIAQMC